MFRSMLVVLVGFISGTPGVAAEPRIPDAVRHAMQDRRFGDAIEAISGLDRDDKTLDHDYLAYLVGRAWYLQDQFEEAIRAYDQAVTDYPDSPWARRCRFAKGQALARKGDFKAAQDLYRREAEYLLSADRKQEIAAIYLEFADVLFEPKKPDVKPDYQRALEFYQSALAVGPRPETRRRVELQVARCQQNLGKHGEAIQLYKAFVLAHLDSSDVVEARYLLGDAQLTAGQPVEARRTWQDLLEIHRGDDSPRLPLASLKLASTFQFPQPNDELSLARGVSALEAYLREFPQHQDRAQALLLIAQAYQHRGRHVDAVNSLRRLLEQADLADTEQVPTARRLLGTSLKLQNKFDDAIEVWREFLVKHSTNPQWSDVQRELIEVEFAQAQYAFNNKEYQKARELWLTFLAKYPLDARNKAIQLSFGRMNYQREQWDAAINDWRELVAKYPNTDESSEAQFRVAQTLEQKLKKFDAALEEYRKLNWGKYASQAVAAVTRMTAKTIEVSTPRIYRSHEVPAVRLKSRNVQAVNVRVYSIDLETYFRKMHLGTGVTNLDIALIDPDHTFEFEVPDFAEYQQFDSSIPIPLDRVLNERDAGVMAVTVSSELHEATTLLLRSDLDIIVKSSREETFVWAENMRTQTPWVGARLLLSDGQKIFTQGTTNEDGVFRFRHDNGLNADSVRVFAIADEHTASNWVNLSGVSVSQGLQATGHLYTDRPVYRPGQSVNMRAVVREVRDDVYVIPQGRSFKLRVIDPRDRVLFEEEANLSEFGTAFDSFLLPQAAALGTYRITLCDDDACNFQGQFQVQTYQLQPVRLEVAPERRVYQRGETIQGKIRLSYDFGGALANRVIRYQLGNDRIYTGTTNDQGEIAFQFATRDLPENQVLAITATYAERNLQQAENVRIAGSEFSVQVKTTRNTFLTGEPFEVEIQVADLNGKPKAQQLSMRIFRETKVQNKVGEEQIRSLEVETDPQGSARQSLTLEAGGTYRIRVEGTDRFDVVVAAEHRVTISDDSDQTRLRLLSDRFSYHVGESLKAKIHWREDPALALIAFQGARVLKYQLLELKRGLNPIELPMTAELAPNFDLVITVMANRNSDSDSESQNRHSFHKVSTPIRVSRKLNVELAWKNKQSVFNPGTTSTLLVRTTDLSGAPVSGEVSIAMVQDSLLRRFAVPNRISSYFVGRPRVSAIRSSTSITYQDSPRTQPIDRRLLAEQERLEVAEMERTVMERLRLSGSNRAMFGINAGQDSTNAFAIQPGVVNAPQLGAMQQSGPTQTLVQQSVDGLQRVQLFSQADGQPQGQFYFSRLGQLDDQFRWGFPSIQAGTSIELNVRSKGGVQEFLTWEEFQGLAPDVQRELQLLSPVQTQETGYWNPSVVTNNKGVAEVEIRFPNRSTAWTLLADGISVDTLAGEGQLTARTRKELFAELALPSAFTDGDRATLVATIHYQGQEATEAQIVLEMTLGETSVTKTRMLDLPGAGVYEVPFEVTVKQDQKSGFGEQQAKWSLRLTAGDASDLLMRSVPVLPHGISAFSIKSGTSQGDVTVAVDHPKQMSLSQPYLRILVGPSVERSLLDALEAPAPVWQLRSNRLSPAGRELSSDLLAALAIQKLMQSSRPDEVTLRMLDQKIRSLVAAMVSSQTDSGDWTWTGAGGRADAFQTARQTWALALARDAGYQLPDTSLKAAVVALQRALAAARVSDYETKAVLLHALTVAGRSDFTQANQLYRNRQSLSSGALAYLALTFLAMERTSTADEILNMIAQRGFQATGSKRTQLAWLDSQLETRALYSLGLLISGSDQVRAAREIEWLMGQRIGHRWSPDRVTGPAVMAAALWYAQDQFQSESYQLQVSVNGTQVAQLDMTRQSPSQVVTVPMDALKEGSQSIRFELNGRARFAYQCVLGGFVENERVASTTQDFHVDRYFEPAPLEFEGREIPRGFTIIQGNYRSFRNELTELPRGQRGVVELRPYRSNIPSNTADEYLEYLVLTEPLPAGVSVIESSIQGDFERYELRPGSITFFLGTRRSFSPIRFEVHGMSEGDFRVGPTQLQNAYQPDLIAVHKNKPTTVIPLGSKSRDPYRLTPDELFAFGKAHFDKDQFKLAAQHLTDLIDHWNLKSPTHRETVRMLMDVHLVHGPASQVVRNFEIIIEKYPDLEVAFGKLLKVGEAYHEIGEYERGYLVFRAAVEASFLRESRVGGYLQSQQQFIRGVQVMKDLLQEYPPESYVAKARYSLAGQIYAKAEEAEASEELKRNKWSRVFMIREAAAMLDSFLTAYPTDPAADEASFSLAKAFLDLELFERTIQRCQQYALRYPTSEKLDSFWYIIGYCHFAMGNHDAALKMCNQVAAHQRKEDGTGRMLESANKWQAVYILGQIFHSLGKAEDAIREYTRVKDRFVDARQAIDYFTRKQLLLPEVTTFRPGEPIEIPLEFRNVAQCETTVYRIDLMKYSLLRRDLSEISNINLAGIRPDHQQNIKLGDGRDYRDRKQVMKLPLDQEGAYLVVTRGEQLYTSGMVLISPLSVEVQEEQASGRVRVTVRNAVTGGYVKEAHVKVIGTRNQEFVSGETDLRGVFVADGILGRSMIVVRTDERLYAFYRGTKELGPAPQPTAPAQTQLQVESSNAAGSYKKATKGELLKNIDSDNTRIQKIQRENLDFYYNNSIQEGIGGGFGGGIFK